MWGRMVDEHLTAIAVRDEVRKIRPPKSIRMHGRSGRLAVLRREVQRLRVRDELLALIGMAKERLEKLGLAAAAEESPVGTKLVAG